MLGGGQRGRGRQIVHGWGGGVGGSGMYVWGGGGQGER